MPGASVDGYPYPLGSEPVAQGDDAIKALALKLDGRTARSGMAAGTANANVAGVAVSPLVTVTLPVGRFALGPKVMIQCTGTGWISTLNYSTLSTTSFQFNIKSTTGQSGTGNQPCPWIAINTD